MSTVINGAAVASPGGVLSKERTIAGPGFNRWQIAPAALAIHLCIGMAYGLSTFWLPLSKAVGIKAAVACPAGTGFMDELFVTACDWKVATLNWMFTLAIVILGVSAALWGGWLERVGPRKAGVVAAVCWSGGLAVAALGVQMHQFWLMLVGGGLIGGVGLGLGYISPVSTLIKWFPDKRGMATGIAIMGFGGGAMVGSPLATLLMKNFASSTSVGVAQTLFVLAAVYLVWMLFGAMLYRVPPSGWKPEGWTPPVAQASDTATARGHVHVSKIWGIPQFWLVWIVLCMNVSAGIGVLSMGSPMLQEVFGGSLIGVDKHFSDLDKGQLTAIAAIGGSFLALLSLFNIGGRFVWASLSDKLGRKTTYAIFFILGGLLYASVPQSAAAGSKFAFVAAFCVILSMYGGGFATVPAYLSDLFGTQMVGAIHGRLLTAWSVAGALGPIVVANMRQAQLDAGVPHQSVYNNTMYILVGMLVVGFIANLLVKPVNAKWFMTDAELAEERRIAHERAASNEVSGVGEGNNGSALVGAIGWIAVGLPLAWGLYMALNSVSKFFH